MKELTTFQKQALLKRFPDFELSYETISHKKVSEQYNLCISIPSGKKLLAWFTFDCDKDVCFFIDLNKEKKISRIQKTNYIFHPSLSRGTLLYGVLSEDQKFFIVEDLFFYKGIPLTKLPFGEKLGYLYKLFKNDIYYQAYLNNDATLFVLPAMWYKEFNDKETIEDDSKIPEIFLNDSQQEYTCHHLQYRSLKEITPYLNVSLNKKINLKSNNNTNVSKSKEDNVLYPKITLDFTKPQYKYPTVFKVKADIQFDIYHLYAFGKNNSINYYNVAYIPNYRSSVFMNNLFRNIKENKNLDLIEESDDEDDFENTNIDKYVDLNKSIFMECIFHHKFKKWIPIKVIQPPCKVVHINQLVSKYILT